MSRSHRTILTVARGERRAEQPRISADLSDHVRCSRPAIISGFTPNCISGFELRRHARSPMASWRTSQTGQSDYAAKRGSRLFVREANDHLRAYIRTIFVELDELLERIGLQPRTRYTWSDSEKVIERCLLMTTDPGDLVLDPTCGSGTTAYVAEQWGRRWITIDTSRVALALARTRLMAARFPYYLLADSPEGAGEGGRS